LFSLLTDAALNKAKQLSKWTKEWYALDADICDRPSMVYRSLYWCRYYNKY